jgi:hypothetical protein
MPVDERPRAELSAVSGMTLDDLVASHDFRPSHIKVDVEGAEEQVFRSGRKVLAGADSPLLFVELHNQIVSASGRSRSGALEILSELGYSFFGHRGEPLEPFALTAPDLSRVIAAKSCHREIIDGLDSARHSRRP